MESREAWERREAEEDLERFLATRERAGWTLPTGRNPTTPDEIARIPLPPVSASKTGARVAVVKAMPRAATPSALAGPRLFGPAELLKDPEECTVLSAQEKKKKRRRSRTAPPDT